MRGSHINVTISSKGLGDRSYDLRIPTRIETKRLIMELEKIFKQTLCHEKYQIKVKNKGFILDEGHYLSEFQITDGDVLEVMES
ncbi:putative ubiquitin-like protein YukD [Streptococcus rupicaprae]|uniref:Ubiquitin-like protein YukD n=1 Tax=Streptococcus rupicaprae TaxID=759619 RepID=A0ABV2FH56_9STRE